MVNYDQQIKELEEELQKTPYNKHTQGHIGLIKAKISRLRAKQVARSSSKSKTTGFSVRKSGDGTVIFIGFPSVGKSTLLNKLTNAESKTGSYAFTTLDIIPGLLEYRQAKIQILDVPGIIKGAAGGKGSGKAILSAVRNADLVVLLIDVFEPEQAEVIKKELYDAGIRLNQEKPDVAIKKAMRGGIQVNSTVKLRNIEEQTIKTVLQEFHISNAYVLIRQDINVDQLIDTIEGNRKYIKAINVVNKADLASPAIIKRANKVLNDPVMISAERGDNTEKLKDIIFDQLNFIRIYLKKKNNKPDMEEPLIMPKGTKIKDVCNKLHRNFVNRFRFGRVWGKSAKFPGQRFQLGHKLEDEDILQLNFK